MPLGSNTKFYETPNHPFQGERIDDEARTLETYGLKNKEELWRAQSELRSYRQEARDLLGDAQGDAEVAAEAGAEFLARLKRYGILDENESLDDVLSLDLTDVLERRLQTVVYRSGLANTPNQARQFINHGHITLDGARVSTPSMKVESGASDDLEYEERSPLADDLHPERAGGDQE
ncbi:30S ribosomal protein S4 [Halosegnis longus]|uniref:Small ribosomal subunit protein uS4 n=1 Tax=Halosegnis longus TaxID=2216012 RepID=A0AAJ4UVN2_9EURY|nr:MULTISPECIES: 30S ribosomal protein S4 [Halobacteriales]RNJ26181.1 30S ribosomal protein S4 [Salella cibi]